MDLGHYIDIGLLLILPCSVWVWKNYSENIFNEKLNNSRSSIYKDLNGLGIRINGIESKLEQQAIIDKQHDKEISKLECDIENMHDKIDARFGELAEKIDEVKDLLIAKLN